MIDRRSFIAGLTMTMASGGLSQALPTAPDAVIIGAGAAGLAAARVLMAAGKTVVVVEARNRIGGRAYTESRSLGQPFDHGCQWLQGPSDLPHIALAQANGMRLEKFSGANEQVYRNGTRAATAQARQYWSTFGKIEAAADSASGDVSVGSLVDKTWPWFETAAAWFGPLDFGVDLDHLSAADYNAYADYEVDYLVRDGLGELAARYGADIPVSLSTKVHAIDWSGGGVRIETSSGTITATACILTVPVGVLAARHIRFVPELPEEKLSAIEHLPMGLLEKIGLRFDGERFGLADSALTTVLKSGSDAREQCQFLSFPTGHDYVVGFVGGSFGWEIAKQGEAAAIDFAVEEFVRAVGSDARKHLTSSVFTGWAEDPNCEGAYSALLPGGAGSREVLAEPLADRLYFAGEATSPDLPALFAGAHLSGVQAAAQVLGRLAGTCGACDARHAPRKGSQQEVRP